MNQPQTVSSFGEKQISDSGVDLLPQIQEVIMQFVRPALMQDGGDIEVCQYQNGVLSVRLVGACSGCPHSQQTLKMHIEKTVRYYVPEVISVETVSD